MSMPSRGLTVRWTIGDVSEAGFEALALSVRGARACFGASARYVVCVNTVPLDEARRRLADLAPAVELRAIARESLPRWLARFLDAGLSQGTAWKLAPVRLNEGGHELALDNDCVLWRVPDAIARWLDDPDPTASLIAEDARACHGAFASLCGEAPRNSGIRGLGPATRYEAALRAVLARHGRPLRSELDEQGLQIAALLHAGRPHVVSIDEVSICSPVPPHRPGLGRAGAHFVGLNARVAWCEIDGRPITERVQAHWHALREEVGRRIDEAERRARGKARSP
jgi:hypothetical protein